MKQEKRSLTKKEADFFDLIALEISSGCDNLEDIDISVESIKKAKDAIDARMWALINDEKAKKNVSDIIGASVWAKANSAAINKKANLEFDHILNKGL